jgi:hypothetical protein
MMPHFTRHDVFAALVCAILAALFAMIPHWQSLAQHGSAEFLADGDDVLYLAICRAPYHGSAALVDPFDPQSGRPTLYPWLPYVPTARLAAASQVPLFHLGFVWRALGGMLMGAAVFVLYRVLLHRLPGRMWLAVIGTLFSLADPGTLTRPMIGLLQPMQAALRGDGAALEVGQHGLFRVTTPLVVLPFAFALAAIISAPLNLPRAAAAALLLAALVYLYFFAWTAAVAAIALLVVIFAVAGLVTPRERSEHWRQAAWLAGVIVAGLALGAPQIIDNAQKFADPALKPALDRMARGVMVPAGDPLRMMYLKNVWALGTIALGIIAAFVGRDRGLAVLLAFTVAGFALRNSAIITGLEFENYHWNYVHGPAGEVLLVTIGLMLLARSKLCNRVTLVVAMLVVLMVFAASAFTHWQRCRLGPEAVKLHAMLDELRDLRPTLETLDTRSVIAGPPVANIALLFTRGGQLYQFHQTSHSSVTTDREVNERFALNAALIGLDVTHRDDPNERFQVSLLKRPEWEWPAVEAERAAILNELRGENGRALLKKYAVTHLLLPAGRTPGVGSWQIVKTGSTWTLWTTKPQ